MFLFHVHAAYIEELLILTNEDDTFMLQGVIQITAGQLCGHVGVFPYICRKIEMKGKASYLILICERIMWLKRLVLRLRTAKIISPAAVIE